MTHRTNLHALASTAAPTVLVIRTARGDREALAALYDRYGPALYRLAVAARLERPEQFVVDVFMRVWRHAGDYDPALGTVGRWLANQAIAQRGGRPSTA